MNPGTNSGNTTTLDQILWQDSQRVFAALGQAQGSARSSVAALSMLTWDILTSMDEEVKLIWAIQNVQFAMPCVPWLIFQIISTFMVEAAVQIIIILRVYAVYATQPKILRFMLLGFAVEVAIMAVSLGLSINKVRTGWGCRTADLPTEMVLYSTASVVYESFLFGVMMYGIIRGAKEGFSNTTLLNSLVRDGAVAFLGVFMVMLMNTILFTMAPSTLVTLGFPWLLAILGVAGPRLISNLRAQHANNIGGPSSLEDLRFHIPSHFYSALNLDDENDTNSERHAEYMGHDLVGLEEHNDGDDESGEEGEHVALNPRRRMSNRGSGSGSDGGSHTPPSPHSPPMLVTR
ncbi:hypothetical protein BC628DRAFT_1313246 [Trametes gibbosa]|nr:hypothetical protein BC628DRAFT_1313246 [Trametes gibbosa]